MVAWGATAERHRRNPGVVQLQRWPTARGECSNAGQRKSRPRISHSGGHAFIRDADGPICASLHTLAKGSCSVIPPQIQPGGAFAQIMIKSPAASLLDEEGRQSGDRSDEDAFDYDTPLADSHRGFYIFSDVARPLRHLDVEQLRDSDSPGAEVFRMRLAKPRPAAPAPRAQDAIGDLVARRYRSRGFHVPRSFADPNLFTFAAYDDGQLVGTVSMRFDSPAGLMADQLYPEEIGRLRANDLWLCEFTRLALDEQAMSKEVLGALFHSCYLYAHVVCGLTHAVIEVNPRHVVFYRRVLHFRVAGEQRHNQRVDAPAVLLQLDFSVIARELERFFSNPDWRSQTKSFFVHWFSPEDTVGIVNRLRRDHEAGRAAA